jgi:MFS family permease
MSAAAHARQLPIWRALGVRDFRLLWASEAVSVIGDQFHLVALSWLVISVTGSGLALGTVLIAVAIPRALLLAPVGVLADRRPGRSLMLIANILRCGIVAAIALVASMGVASVPLLAVLGVLFGAADALYMPAQQAFLPRAVGADRLPSANALLQGTYQLASIAGPPLAGIVIAAAGTGAAFAVDAGSFAIATVLIGAISGVAVASRRQASSGGAEPRQTGAGIEDGEAAGDLAASPDRPAGSFAGELLGGIRYVAADPAIRILMLVSLALNFAVAGPSAVGIAWLASQRFDAGALGLGVMTAGFAIGGLAGTLLAGNIHLERQGRVVLGSVAVTGIGMAAVGLLGWLPAVVVATAVIGVTIGYTNVVAVSWLQARVDPAVVGRVMSLVMLMGFGITPLSIAIAGALVDVDATALFVGSGVLILATVGLGALVRMPSLLDERVAPRQVAAA